MAATPSTMMPLGTVAPDFNLEDTVSGQRMALQDLRGAKGTLVMFICNHCPFVVHIQKELTKVGNDYKDSGVSVVAINSNDIENYPDDSPDRMKEVAEQFGYPFPYLFDATQEVARAYNAACTPDFFLFDADLKCAYRGPFDSARPGNSDPITGADLRKVQFKDAWLDGTNMEGANVTDTDLSVAKRFELEGAAFWGANMRRINLKGAALVGANMERAFLGGSHLEGASMRGANLREANMIEAVMEGTILEGANLNGAMLNGADLRGARFNKADIRGIVLSRFLEDGPHPEHAGIYNIVLAASISKSKMGKELEAELRGSPRRARYAHLFHNNGHSNGIH